MNISKNIGIWKLLAVFIAAFIITSYVCADTSVFAQTETKEGTLYVESKTVEKGDKFTVTISIKDNPGIWGLKFKVGYDHSVFKLVSATNGKIFENEDTILPSDLNKEEYIYLANLNNFENNKQNGSVLALEFTASKDAEFKPYIVSLKIEQAINVNGEDIALKANDGTVSVVKCIHVSDTKWSSDAENHWHNCKNADCGEKILKTVEKHKVVVIPAVSSTCTKDGLTAGKKCSVCGYIIEKQQVVKAKGHTPVKLKAVKATVNRTGLTAGSKCKICGEILQAQKVIPKIKQTHTITMKKSARTTQKIKMYQKKNKASKVLKRIKAGEKITILDIKKDWYCIKYKGKIGYIKATGTVWKAKVTVDDGNLILRSGPSKKYSIISSYGNGTRVYIYGRTKNGWYKVRVKNKKNGKQGYMYTEFLK